MTLAQLLSAIVPNEYVHEPIQAQSLLQYYMNLTHNSGLASKARICQLGETFHAPERIAYANRSCLLAGQDRKLHDD